MGKYFGADLLAKRTPVSNVIMNIYLVRQDKGPLTCNIMFYNPDENWEMQSFKYQNNKSEELEELKYIE